MEKNCLDPIGRYSAITFMNTSRNKDLDFICGLLIIHMCLSHIALLTNTTYPLEKLFFFFMPWFYFKAGMYHKEEKEHVIVSKAFKRLMIPFFVFTLIGQLISFVTKHNDNVSNILILLKSTCRQLFWDGAAYGDAPLWFLLSLFLVKILFNYLITTALPPPRAHVQPHNSTHLLNQQLPLKNYTLKANHTSQKLRNHHIYD